MTMPALSSILLSSTERSGQTTTGPQQHTQHSSAQRRLAALPGSQAYGFMTAAVLVLVSGWSSTLESRFTFTAGPVALKKAAGTTGWAPHPGCPVGGPAGVADEGGEGAGQHLRHGGRPGPADQGDQGGAHPRASLHQPSAPRSLPRSCAGLRCLSWHKTWDFAGHSWLVELAVWSGSPCQLPGLGLGQMQSGLT